MHNKEFKFKDLNLNLKNQIFNFKEFKFKNLKERIPHAE